MTTKIRIAILQSSGADGRYAKLKLQDERGTTTVELTHEQLGQLISGVALDVTASLLPGRQL